jgi:mannose-6-phosphate isomerase-like protein (cupin superfamily)
MERINRPWGWYENIQEDTGYKVKRLYVQPNKKISLQYHIQRNEHWIVVSGDGKFELNEIVKDVSIGDYIFVPMTAKHRIVGGSCGIMIIEIQLGKICDEEDIVRLEDEYGRI